MKKIFTFIVSAMVAGSAFAMPAAQHREVVSATVDFDKLEMASKRVAAPEYAFDASVLNGPMRVMMDGSSQEWDATFRLMGPLTDYISLTYDGENMVTFDEFPVYLVTNALVTGTSAARTQLQNYIIWPARAYLYEDLIDKNWDIIWDKAIERFGSKEEASMPMTINELIEFAQEFWGANTPGFLPVLNQWAPYPYIVNTYLANRNEAAYKWQGKDYAINPCEITDEGQFITQNRTYAILKAYDPEMGDFETEWSYAFGTFDGQGGATNVQLKQFVLNGDPVIIGFKPVVTEGAELHVFNCGLTDQDTAWGDLYMNSFEPVQRYFAMWCDYTMSFMGQKQDGTPVQAWDKYDISPDGKYPITPVAVRSNDYIFNCWNATFYAPKDSEFAGLWSMPEPKISDADEWESVPTAYQLIPAYNVFAEGERDGFWGIIGGFYVNPSADYTVAGAADRTQGFNWKYTAPGWGENEIMGNASDKYYYHYDPTDFDVMREENSIGTANANAIEYSFDASVETVESNAPVVSTQYFNLQGQRLNVAPQHGIFIQRDIKADGSVKAVKVAK